MILRRVPICRCAILAAVVGFAVSALPQTGQRISNPSQNILDELAPGGVIPDKLSLPPMKRARAVRALLEARRSAAKSNNEPQRQQILYLLATLGYEYERNRDDLLVALKGCSHQTPTSGCDDMTGEYLMKLYRQGHKELLRPLFAAYPTWNAALQEELGGFMGDQLAADTQGFLVVVSGFPAKAQRRICYAAGSEDGGGMPPKDFAQAMRNLKAAGGEVAERCQRQLLAAKRDAEDAVRNAAKP